MNQQEAAALLGVAAAFDNRKPDPDAALAWSIALTKYRFEDCRDAIVAHYQATSDWLMPVHVIAGARAIRSRRLALFTGSMSPPRELADDPRAELEWLADRKRRVMDGEWPDDSHEAGQLMHRDVRELGQVGRVPDTTDHASQGEIK